MNWIPNSGNYIIYLPFDFIYDTEYDKFVDMILILPYSIKEVLSCEF